MRTIDQVIAALPSPDVPRLPAPEYHPRLIASKPRIGLAVESMARHTTDEGWQLFQGLESADYEVWFGGSLLGGDVKLVLDNRDPSVVVLQDKREWEGLTAGGPKDFDQRERFTNVSALRERDDVFKLTVLKDAHANPSYHRQSADEIGCHAWAVYYHPRIVAHLAPWVRPEHLVRTWHSIDAGLVPPFSPTDRSGCLISGALGGAYPLRSRLARAAGYWPPSRIQLGGEKLPGVDVLPHPGYHRQGCATPKYLRTLSRYKMAICTSSIYGYTLRKIIEAVACGCRVITDLPVDDRLPFIDPILLRVGSDATIEEIAWLVKYHGDNWDAEQQEFFAKMAREVFDYRTVGKRLAADIEKMRRSWSC